MRYAAFLLFALVACGDDDGFLNPDAGNDAGIDAPMGDTGTDAPTDDAEVDAGVDATTDDAGVDASGMLDAGTGPTITDITDPSMVPRQGHSFGVVGDGRAIVAGGTGEGRALYETWALDLGTTTWELLSELPAPHYGASSIVLPDGRMVISGGAPSTFALTSYDTIFIFDPETDAWTAGGTMTEVRDAHSMVLLESGPDAGKVLIFGGQRRGASVTYLTTFEIYDPSTMTSRALLDTLLSSPRASHFHYTLSDGRIVIAGGYTNPGDPADSAVDEILIYDPSDESLDVQTETLPEAELFRFLGILPDGDALLFPSAYSTQTIRRMDPETFETTDIGTVDDTLRFYGLARIPAGTAFLFGGYEDDVISADVRAFDPVSEEWALYEDLLPRALGGIWPSALPDDRVLLLGGQTEIGFLIGDTLIFTP